MVDRVELGTAAVTRVVEWQVDQLPLTLFPQTPLTAWRELATEYTPTFWEGDHWRIAIQTWVVEVDGLTVLVDTGVGNDRDRPAMPALDHLNTDFLDSLQRAGAVAGRRACPCAFDDDLAAAAVTRKRVLTEATRRPAATRFIVDGWLEITPI